VGGVFRLVAGAAQTDPTQDAQALRNALVAGEYEPSAATTGVIPGTTLTDYNASSVDKVTLPAGTVLSNKRIYGDITPGGPVTLRNCLLVGGTSQPSSDIGVVTATGSLRSGLIELYDCSIIPRAPKNGRNGVQGRQYKAVRCYVKNTTDGFGVFSTLGSNTAADVTIQQCMVEELLYSYPDPASSNHSDGAHTDCVQIQGGRNVRVIGNKLVATAIAETGTGANPQKPWLLERTPGWANGGCVVVQDNTGAGIDSSVVIDSNWTSGGLSHYNIKASAAGSVIQNGNVYRDTAVGTGNSGYWGRLETGMSQTAITGITTHRWIDGPYAGELLTFASRDRGLFIG
jgi:hypothetical protein